jgi:hypothetical protein
MLSFSLVGMHNQELNQSVVGFLHTSEVHKVLANACIKANYIRFLTHFKTNPTTFNKEQCAYLRAHLPQFEQVQSIINQSMESCVTHFLELKQERIALIKAEENASPEATFLQENYGKKFKENMEKANPDILNEVIDNAIYQASSKLLNIIETTTFHDLGGITVALTAPQVLKENELIPALQQFNLSKKS